MNKGRWIIFKVKLGCLRNWNFKVKSRNGKRPRKAKVKKKKRKKNWWSFAILMQESAWIGAKECAKCTTYIQIHCWSVKWTGSWSINGFTVETIQLWFEISKMVNSNRRSKIQTLPSNRDRRWGWKRRKPSQIVWYGFRKRRERCGWWCKVGAEYDF